MKRDLAGAIVGAQSAAMGKGFSGSWGGKHPMAHKDSEAQGRLVPGNYLGALATKLNIVQAKEASLLIHWLEGKQIPVKDDRDEQLAEIRTLIAARVGATNPQM